MEKLIDLQSWLLSNPQYFGVFFVVMWFSVTLIFSRVTGWYKLAERYRTHNKPDSKLMYAVKVYWGTPILAGNIYTVGSSRKGLYLGVLFPFRFGHPPLLIPWSQIKSKKVQRLFIDHIQLSFGNDLSRPFEITEKVAKKLKAGSHNQFDY